VAIPRLTRWPRAIVVVRMHPFDLAAVLIAVAAVAGYANHRLLRLPPTSGTLVVALACSLVVAVIEAVVPGVRERVAVFLGAIDFNQALMHGMLCFLLFAGALHVDLTGLLEQKWTIGLLSTVGVLISTAVTGALTWWTLGLAGTHLSFSSCLLFGAIISPTDPVAVMGLLKELNAPPSLEAQIAGESLFNDGVSVVVFFALLSLAGVSVGATAHDAVSASEVLIFLVREVAGGAALGLLFGYIGYRALLSIDDHPLELLITLATAMFLYAASFWIGVSGPIAVVIAGLLIGNPGRRFAMSTRTKDHVDAFWNMADEILNAVLFLLIGLQFLAAPALSAGLAAGLLAIPIALIARLVSVAVPVAALSIGGSFAAGIVPVLTWCGLRGGISVAMALSLPPFPGRDLFVAGTYAVVVFSILAQGLTVRRLLAHYRIGE
jgi:CPA1 family monovalent cation:H+ antiporter